MHKLLNERFKYAPEYGTKFNAKKSSTFNFKGYRFKANPLATLYFDVFIMKTDTSYTYLGHITRENFVALLACVVPVLLCIYKSWFFNALILW